MSCAWVGSDGSPSNEERESISHCLFAQRGLQESVPACFSTSVGHSGILYHDFSILKPLRLEFCFQECGKIH